MKKINALGDKCPIPVIKAKNALKDMEINEELIIEVDNFIATENLSKLSEEYGYEKHINKINDEHYEVKVIKKEAEVNTSIKDDDKNLVIAVSSDKMGEGNDELGEVLLKGFIYAVTELDTLPKTILFYNGGAKVTSEGSKSIDDLKKLSENGVEILTCGTCMDYYNIKDKLQVGGVTNMYTILEKLSKASKVIKP